MKASTVLAIPGQVSSRSGAQLLTIQLKTRCATMQVLALVFQLTAYLSRRCAIFSADASPLAVNLGIRWQRARSSAPSLPETSGKPSRRQISEHTKET